MTSSAIVVGVRGVLLHRHRRLGIWLQPGGHVEQDEAVADAARRECLEETGLVVLEPSSGPYLLHVDAHDSAKGHRHLDVRYLVAGPDAEPRPPTGESQEVEWCSWDEAFARGDRSLAAALRQARRMARSLLPLSGAPGEDA